MPEKTYTRTLGENARKRYYHKTEKGKVVDFVVQMEVRVEGQWKSVIRYDCSHNFAHVDRYNIKGEQEKEEINLPYVESLTLADEDINIDGIVRSRHSGESRNPEVLQLIEKTGFLLPA